MLVEERVSEYSGIIDWFKDLVGIKPKATKNTEEAKNTEHGSGDIEKLLLFGGLAIAVLVFLSSAESRKKQAIGG